MKVRTYNCKKVIAVFGNHIMQGPADGTFITIEQSGDGVTKVVGAYGEVQRSRSPDETYALAITLLWGSPTNEWLRNMLNKDRVDDKSLFPVIVKDLVGGTLFQAEEAWVAKEPNISWDLTAPTCEWAIETGQAGVTGGSIY